MEGEPPQLQSRTYGLTLNAADLNAFGDKQVTQHLAAREREIHMQLVDAPHDGQISRRGRPRRVIDAAPADPQLPRLLRHRQRVRTIDHRFALGNRPALLRSWAERP